MNTSEVKKCSNIKRKLVKREFAKCSHQKHIINIKYIEKLRYYIVNPYHTAMSMSGPMSCPTLRVGTLLGGFS